MYENGNVIKFIFSILKGITGRDEVAMMNDSSPVMLKVFMSEELRRMGKCGGGRRQCPRTLKQSVYVI